MIRSVLLFFLLSMLFFSANAQNKQLILDKKFKGENTSGEQKRGFDSALRKEKVTGKIKLDTDATYYKIITERNDTTFIDTSLTISKHYKFNYLRKDYLELLPFSNTGQVFNWMGRDFADKNQTFSLFGARAKHIDYAETADIKYYEVATPFTELFFKTTMEQGQLAEGFLSVNTMPRLNFTIAYKGLRSIGKYRNIKSINGRLKSSVNYRTKNDKYFLRAHMAIQSIETQENGGIVDEQIPEFENGNSEFDDRSRFDVNFEDASNQLEGKRFYLNHHYHLLAKKDSLQQYNISVGHKANLEDKKYLFDQDVPNGFFGDAFTSTISDEVRLERLYNEGFLRFNKKTLGALTAHVGYTDYNYGYNSIAYLNNGVFVPNRIKSGFLSYGLGYKNQFKKFQLEGNFKSNLSEGDKGSYLDALLKYTLFKDLSLEGKMVIQASLPNFNYRLYQSDYKNYNWYNPNMALEKKQTLQGRLGSKKLKASVQVSYSLLQDYAYFGVDPLTNSVKPFQAAETINYLKVKVNKEFTYRRFSLDNWLVYQNVQQETEVFNVPQLIARSAFYYTNTFFKDNLYLQTGFSGSYFSKYKMNAYDPLLGEFYVQNQEDFGAFPRFDVFINAKVRNARIYFKWEHVNSSFTGNNYYSAPTYPYKDRIIRFGLVWNFFL